MSAEERILVIALPSLCADAWTLDGLLHKIAEAYEVCAVQSSWLADPLQYADLAEWQNDLLVSDEEDAKAGRSYWSDGQGNFLKGAALPVDSDLKRPTAAGEDVLTTHFERELSPSDCRDMPEARYLLRRLPSYMLADTPVVEPGRPNVLSVLASTAGNTTN